MTKKSISFLILVMPLFVTSPNASALPEKVRKHLDGLWEDLLSADELRATRALLQFAKQPNTDVTDYLRGKLKPLILSKDKASQLLKALGGKDKKLAQAAFDEFLYFDPRLALDDEELRAALLGPAELKVSAILCELPFEYRWSENRHWYSPDNQNYRFSDATFSIFDRDISIRVAGIGEKGGRSSWVRAVRAIGLLESIGTADAQAILRAMATGHQDAFPTKAAKTALQRMKS